MFSTCIFCGGPLGRNKVIEAFSVGRRPAFDLSRGRLWVLCPGCRQWKLSRLEERSEAPGIARARSDRRALEGELAALEAAWRAAEEIAAIADDLPDPGSDPALCGATGR